MLKDICDQNSGSVTAASSGSGPPSAHSSQTRAQREFEDRRAGLPVAQPVGRNRGDMQVSVSDSTLQQIQGAVGSGCQVAVNKALKWIANESKKPLTPSSRKRLRDLEGDLTIGPVVGSRPMTRSQKRQPIGVTALGGHRSPSPLSRPQSSTPHMSCPPPPPPPPPCKTGATSKSRCTFPSRDYW